MVKRITHRQREKAWNRYQAGDAISQIAKSIRVSYASAWILTEGRKQGYKNYSEYQEHLAQQRVNPDTGELYKNYSENLEHLAQQKINPDTGELYKNYSEYYGHLAQQRQQNPENKELSGLIKSRLKELGRNQSWLAEQMSVTRAAISLYALGKILPNTKHLERLFSALNVARRPKSLDGLIEKE